MTDGLRRLDEGAAHVVAANQTEFERQAGFFGKAKRGGNTGIGDRHHHVGIGRTFARQRAPVLFAHRINVASEDRAVGPREVNILEDTALVKASPERA